MGLGVLLTAILAKIAAFAAWFVLLVVAMYAAWWLLGTDLGVWFFEQLLKLVISIMNTISFDFSAFNPGQYISALPADVVNMLGLIRVGEALAIIVAAIVVRVTLQLIPFTRLGS
ncbi:MAG: hypothetical protein A3F74_15945 [Betaproteobacteria bacterium RIFCSPLOWO2_12_FULL_62_58]|nr:MAG: hypothetical protein A3I62_04005 [Betaproteobacteria bacterium RIFCSPLOWO2_02_FULL_62_79]OGA51800.1 MAG: hypothetical protein A3F74_15945 [Betaproteobacteria bacterium RIFCSPLOWO2_12_FULL_62_58]